MHLDATIAAWLAVAALAGAAVGIEREWSGHASGPDARFAGVRTFFLIGILGGLAGWLLGGGQEAAGLLLLGSGAALTVAAYLVAGRRRGSHAVEATTEIAALVVLAIGAISGLGFPLVTSAVAAIMVLALAEKKAIHGVVRRLGEPELTAAFRFGVMALVILPILPAGPYGPYDSIRPRALWSTVLLFSAINFAAYLARQALGLRRGYSVSGLLGGLVSSTAVTLQFSRKSREDPGSGPALALGVVGACTVLVLRVVTVTAVLNLALVQQLVPYLLPMFLAGAAIFVVLYLRQADAGSAESEEPVANPLGLQSSLLMALAFQVTLLVIGWLQQGVGDSGVLLSAAALGLTDMDALTYGMNRLGGSGEALTLAARGITIGILSNTALKLTVAVLVGRGSYRWMVAVSLLLLAAGGGIGLWVGW